MSEYLIHTRRDNLVPVLETLDKLGIQHDPVHVSTELFDTVEMVIYGDEKTIENDFKLTKTYPQLDLFKKLP
jgi:hypothetical protein